MPTPWRSHHTNEALLASLPSYSPPNHLYCRQRQHHTTPSLSSLRDLAETSSAYSPTPFRSQPSSPVSIAAHALDGIHLSDSRAHSPSHSHARPIPIPRPTRRSLSTDDPVTPLTGRVEQGYYFPHSHRPSSRDRRPVHSHMKARRHSSARPRSSTAMRADNSMLCSTTMSPTLSPSARPASPQQSRRTQNAPKSAPNFRIDNLPRFHPAVYQSNSTQRRPGQDSSQLSAQNYRASGSGSRDPMRQCREVMEGAAIPRTPPAPLSPNPSAPRLDPLRSPGPVTPLALDAGGYLATGAANSSELSSRTKQQGASGPDLVERLVAHEKERERSKGKSRVKTR